MSAFKAFISACNALIVSSEASVFSYGSEHREGESEDSPREAGTAA